MRWKPTAATPSIAELRPGQRFSGAYACVRKDRLSARNGSIYLSLELGTAPGRSPRRVFREVDRLAARFERGDAIRVSGKVERFRGELVAEVDEIQPIEAGELDPAEFLPAAYRDAEELEGFLEHLTREVTTRPSARSSSVSSSRSRWRPSSDARPAPARAITPTSAG